MTRNKKQPTNPTPGFSIQLTDRTELSGAMLIAGDEEGAHQPIGEVISIREAREIATADFHHRMQPVLRGEEESFCPATTCSPP